MALQNEEFIDGSYQFTGNNEVTYDYQLCSQPDSRVITYELFAESICDLDLKKYWRIISSNEYVSEIDGFLPTSVNLYLLQLSIPFRTVDFPLLDKTEPTEPTDQNIYCFNKEKALMTNKIIVTKADFLKNKIWNTFKKQLPPPLIEPNKWTLEKGDTITFKFFLRKKIDLNLRLNYSYKKGDGFVITYTCDDTTIIKKDKDTGYPFIEIDLNDITPDKNGFFRIEARFVDISKPKKYEDSEWASLTIKSTNISEIEITPKIVGTNTLILTNNENKFAKTFSISPFYPSLYKYSAVDPWVSFGSFNQDYKEFNLKSSITNITQPTTSWWHTNSSTSTKKMIEFSKQLYILGSKNNIFNKTTSSSESVSFNFVSRYQTPLEELKIDLYYDSSCLNKVNLFHLNSPKSLIKSVNISKTEIQNTTQPFGLYDVSDLFRTPLFIKVTHSNTNKNINDLKFSINAKCGSIFSTQDPSIFKYYFPRTFFYINDNPTDFVDDIYCEIYFELDSRLRHDPFKENIKMLSQYNNRLVVSYNDIKDQNKNFLQFARLTKTGSESQLIGNTFKNFIVFDINNNLIRKNGANVFIVKASTLDINIMIYLNFIEPKYENFGYKVDTFTSHNLVTTHSNYEMTFSGGYTEDTLNTPYKQANLSHSLDYNISIDNPLKNVNSSSKKVTSILITLKTKNKTTNESFDYFNKILIIADYSLFSITENNIKPSI